MLNIIQIYSCISHLFTKQNMLTQLEYESLWNKHFNKLNEKFNMPEFIEYQKREYFKKMYIDKFKNKGRLIKYILLGECAPTTGNYIYNDGLGSYITAPLNAVGFNTNKDKLDRIEMLNEAGFLLLDLYPFALNYNKVRKKLSEDICFQQKVHSHIIKEISSYGSILAKNWDFCFVAPESTSAGVLEYLRKHQNGELMNNKTIYHQLDLLTGHKDFTDKANNVYKNYVDYNGKMLPKLARLAVRRGSTGPSPDLIKSVFYL